VRSANCGRATVALDLEKFFERINGDVLVARVVPRQATRAHALLF